MIWQDYIPFEIKKMYEIHDYNHAAAILSCEYSSEAREIFEALKAFRFTVEDVKKPGGNESPIPKKFSEILRPLGWKERELKSKMVIDDHKEIKHNSHKVDYIKGRIAFDLEWNSKEQTFDRDLYAFKFFFESDAISVGILVTRSNELDPWLDSLGEYIDQKDVKRQYKDKYGASTTHLGKLLPRLQAGQNGGCPVLVFGITPLLLEEVKND